MISLEQIKRDVKEKNYSAIDFPISKVELNEAADSFLEFLSLPQELKDSMYLHLNPEDQGSNLGYVHRQQSKGKLDDKEYFHYHSDIKELLGNRDSFENPIVKNFLEYADNIYNAGLETLENLLEVLEEGYPEIRSHFFSDDEPFRGFLRFLKYDIKNPGEILAKGHYDRGSITLALAESAPGLRIGKDNKSLKEVEHQDNTSLFMPSISFPKITDDGFTPAWHDVVKKGEDLFNDKISRWALVFFADSHNLEFPTSAETHTPIYYQQS